MKELREFKEINYKKLKEVKEVRKELKEMKSVKEAKTYRKWRRWMLKRAEEVKKSGGSDVSRAENNHHSWCRCEHERRNVFLQEVVFFRNQTVFTSTLWTSRTPPPDRRRTFSTTRHTFQTDLWFISWSFLKQNSCGRSKQRSRIRLDTVTSPSHQISNLVSLLLSNSQKAEAFLIPAVSFSK